MISETVNERFTGKLRWLEAPGKITFQQEYEITTVQLIDPYTRSEQTKTEWRDVPCVLVEK